MKAAAGTGSHEAEVVAGLGELHCKALEGCRVAYVCAGVGSCFNKVGGLFEGVAGEFGHLLGAELGKAGNCIEAGADGGAAHVDFLEENGVPFEVCNLFFQIVCKGVEFLAGGHRHGVLKLGAAHFEDVLEFFTLCTQGGDEVLQGLLYLLVHAEEGVAECRRVCVVGGLCAVHVVVG